MTIAMVFLTAAYNYMTKPSDPAPSICPVGKEQEASRLFSSVGGELTEPLHTVPDRLPAGLQKLSDQWVAEEKARLAESGQTISSPRRSEILVKV
ncbi:hypothetical protein AKI39_08320 [Bordetella sp. H567]|uniref:hypothetical protein n=1 Tax=Bordetella sp. H567 TaxID=1697043 RepID=UPI00081D0467|nr:hypothetical protein [Bordetella sp. H567]AOB30698.1 hypothetical protein AKI39_08320 [Bordetella sp. H567]